jgi:hypothetical protein
VPFFPYSLPSLAPCYKHGHFVWNATLVNQSASVQLACAGCSTFGAASESSVRTGGFRLTLTRAQWCQIICKAIADPSTNYRKFMQPCRIILHVGLWRLCQREAGALRPGISRLSRLNCHLGVKIGVRQMSLRSFA